MHNQRQERKKKREREFAERAHAAAMAAHAAQMGFAVYPSYGLPTPPYGLAPVGLEDMQGGNMMPAWAMQPFTPAPQHPSMVLQVPPDGMPAQRTGEMAWASIGLNGAQPTHMVSRTFKPLPGFEQGPQCEQDEEALPNPSAILRKIRGQLGQRDDEEPSNDFTLKEALKSGQILKDEGSQVVVKATKQSLTASASGSTSGVPSPVRMHLPSAKLDELIEKQEATAAAVRCIEAKLSRLDSLAEGVAGINLTLRRAAEGNRKTAPYVPQRSPMRLPGSRRPASSPPRTSEDDFEA